ncbi:NAD(P)-dependent oxidoreductase [Pseudonocardia sichuanensis]
MHLTIVGATGGIGRHVVDQALAAGHAVTAAVRNPQNVDRDVSAVAVDLARPDPAALRSAVEGADAVLSCLGPRGRHEYGVVSTGTEAILAAMQDTGCRRIIAISGAGVSTAATPARPHPPKREPGAGLYNQYFATPLARLAVGSHFVDVAKMEDLLRASGFAWTALRTPYLTNSALTGRYRTAVERNVRRGVRLSRADAAHLMLRALGERSTFGRAIAAAY